MTFNTPKPITTTGDAAMPLAQRILIGKTGFKTMAEFREFDASLTKAEREAMSRAAIAEAKKGGAA